MVHNEKTLYRGRRAGRGWVLRALSPRALLNPVNRFALARFELDYSRAQSTPSTPDLTDSINCAAVLLPCCLWRVHVLALLFVRLIWHFAFLLPADHNKQRRQKLKQRSATSGSESFVLVSRRRRRTSLSQSPPPHSLQSPSARLLQQLNCLGGQIVTKPNAFSTSLMYMLWWHRQPQQQAISATVQHKPQQRRFLKGPASRQEAGKRQAKSSSHNRQRKQRYSSDRWHY